LIRPSRNMDCTIYAYKFHGYERRELCRTFEVGAGDAASVNDDPQTAWLFSPMAFFVYNDELLTQHMSVDALAEADTDAEVDDGDAGAADSSDNDDDTFFPSGRRVAKNTKLERIPLSRCFVLGRWVGTAAGAKAKERELTKTLQGLSHGVDRIWGARIASRVDTVDIVRPSQIEGKVWRRPLFYGHGIAGFDGDGATGAAVVKMHAGAADVPGASA